MKKWFILSLLFILIVLQITSCGSATEKMVDTEEIIVTEIDTETVVTEEPFYKFENRNFLIIGDSYGVTSDAWSILLKNYIIENGGDATVLCVMGSGFSTLIEYNFADILKNIDNKAQYTDVIIGGGYNDWVREVESSMISAGIDDVLVELNTNYNISNLYLFAIGSHSNYKDEPFTITYDLYGNICESNLYNTYYYSDIHKCLSNPSDFIEDGFHPTSESQKKLFYSIFDKLVT